MLVRDLPSLDKMTCPHFLVVGKAWRHDVVRTILARLSSVGASTVYLGALDPSTIGKRRICDLRTIRLLDAFGRRGESLLKLRDVMVAHAGADGTALARAIDAHLELGSIKSTRVIPGVMSVYAKFTNPRLADGHIEALICDIDDHAIEVKLPRPVLQEREGQVWVDRPRDLIIHRMRSGVAGRNAIRLQVAVRVDDATGVDWRPYAAAGLEPLISDSDLAAAVEIRVIELRSDPRFKATQDVIRDHAQAWVDANPWAVALAQAMPYEVRSQEVTGVSLLSHLAGNPVTAGFAREMEISLGGDQGMPQMWSNTGGHWSVETTKAGSLRRSIFAEALFLQATDQTLIGQPKVVIIDDDGFLSGEPGTALRRLLAQGRKHNLYIMVFCDRIAPAMEMNVDLAPNWLVHDDEKDVLQLRAPVQDDEAPAGWIRCDGSREAQPLALFYQPAEVTAGERVIYGITNTSET